MKCVQVNKGLKKFVLFCHQFYFLSKKFGCFLQGVIFYFSFFYDKKLVSILMPSLKVPIYVH